MVKFCALMVIVGGLTSYVGYNTGSQNMMFVGLLITLSSGAGVDRLVRI